MKVTKDGLKDLTDAINKATKSKVVITEPEAVSSLPSGSLLIDAALGVGGYPFARISEIYGGESAGKSTICLTLCANAQKQGIIPTYIDVETSVDFEYAKQLGVDVDNWVLAQPDDAEDAFRAAEAAVRNGSRLIVLDSVGALIPHRETEEESDIGDNSIGRMALLMSKFVRRISPLLIKYQAMLIMVNQRRAKIGAMPGTSTEDTPGGYALKHAYSIRMKITRTGKESGDDPDYITSKIDVQKNKVAPPYGKANIKIRFGKGIDIWSEIVQIGVELKVLKKSGAWYKHDDAIIGQGEDGAIEWLKSNKEVVNTIFEYARSSVANISPHLNKDFYMKQLFPEEKTKVD